MTKGYPGPLPSTDFRLQVANEAFPPFQDAISGEVAATIDRTLGVARFAAKVSGVVISVPTAGKGHPSPTITIDVRINNVSIFSTKPIITYISGEAVSFKTTFDEAEDTGITAAVINEAANTMAIGDILTWQAQYSGDATPETKMRGPSILVEVEPLAP